MQTEGYAPDHAHLAPRETVQTGRFSDFIRKFIFRFRWKEGGAIDTLERVYHAEGVRRGLFKGLSLNAIKGPLAVGVSFTTYDLLKRALGIEGGGASHGA
jgi:hypothetical protein